MNNAYIRPGGVAQDVSPAAIDLIREMVPEIRRGIRELELLVNENPIVKGRMNDVGILDLTGVHGAGHHRSGAALGRSAARPAQVRSLTAVTRPTTSRSSPATRADAYGRLRIRLDEMYQSLRIVEQCHRSHRSEHGRAGHGRRTRRSPGRLSCTVGSDGMGNSKEHIKEIMGDVHGSR
ncbi:MAG: hypothetical protein V9F04_09510 [Dermatophilaceae bacterium]